jgi:hypothetical protein
MIKLFLLFALMQCIAAYVGICGTLNSKSLSLSAFKNEKEREDQIRLQEEMLARRKNKGKMKEYFESVEKKRSQTAQDSMKNNWAKNTDKQVDPLEAWKMAKANGQIKDIGYDAVPSKSSSLFGLNIPIPVNPIGIPKYDDGERFDLRLPYAERGYEDPDADVIGIFTRGLSALFGGKSKSPTNDDKNNNKK